MLYNYRLQELNTLLMDKKVVRTIKERIFSLTPWRKYKTIKVPADYCYILNNEGCNLTIVGHPVLIQELRNKMVSKQFRNNYNLGYLDSKFIPYNVV